MIRGWANYKPKEINNISIAETEVTPEVIDDNVVDPNVVN